MHPWLRARSSIFDDRRRPRVSVNAVAFSQVRPFDGDMEAVAPPYEYRPDMRRNGLEIVQKEKP